MRAITLWQPWASLWVTPSKVHETRGWPITIGLGGGYLAVHAAARPVHMREIGQELRAIATAEFGADWPRTLPFGAIVGVVELDRCDVIGAYGPQSPDDRAAGNWMAGRWAWHRGRFWRFGRPIPWVGRQRIFHIPEAALAHQWLPPERAPL